ncbi:MAG: hypothetical protein L0206_01130 [Actinobacteria bacterium]|nr:hypothetical protein [Actinomycetota bacterium]
MSYLRLPAVDANDFAATPDHPSLRIAGRIWLAADVAADDWTPAAADVLVSKYTALFNLKSYALQILTNGRLRANISTTGANDITFDSTVAPGGVNGERLAVGVDIEPAVGDGNRRATFYTGPELVGPWSPLGGVVTQAGEVSIFTNTSAVLIVGALVVLNPSSHFAGEVYGAEVRDGGIAGTIVARPVFEAQLPGVDNLHDQTGKRWAWGDGTSLAKIDGPVPPGWFRHDAATFDYVDARFAHSDPRFAHSDPRFVHTG